MKYDDMRQDVALCVYYMYNSDNQHWWKGALIVKASQLNTRKLLIFVT